jgi:DNA-directed RNA polymerase specialized sigma24 family protein
MRHRADFERVARAVGGESAALAAVFDDTFDRVYSFVARRTPGRAATERATQRILERVFAELPRYDGGLPFSAWVLRFVKRELAHVAVAQTAIAPPP